MKPLYLVAAFLCLVSSSRVIAQTNDIDTELSNLADRLAAQIKDQGKTNVAVVDFTDLQGGTGGELGKYVAEQLTVDLVMNRKGFSVLDRANLKRILDEHKLTATGLIDQDSAKKLGQFAGVDAFILGSVVPKGQTVGLTAKIIATDTAEIVGAGKAEFRTNDTVEELLAKPVTEAPADNNAPTNTEPAKPEKPSVKKTLGDLVIEAKPLLIVANRQYNLTLTITNRSPRKSLWVALNIVQYSIKSFITNPDGYSFYCPRNGGVTGLECSGESNGYFTRATEIRPGDSLMAILKFVSPQSREATDGKCNVQVEFLVGDDYWQGSGHCRAENFVATINTQ
ncbi:MAG: FlgO family outer membrane protein [Verrucomicrobiia bacterium]